MRLCCPFRRFFNCIHLFVVVLIFIPQNSSGQLEEVPTPVGKCDAGRMTVSLPTHAIPFKGIIHARGFRSNPNCFANSSSNSFAPPSLNLNLLSQPGDEDYCGVISLKVRIKERVTVDSIFLYSLSGLSLSLFSFIYFDSPSFSCLFDTHSFSPLSLYHRHHHHFARSSLTSQTHSPCFIFFSLFTPLMS